MATHQTARQQLPQGFISTYSPRLRTYRNSLLAPVLPVANTIAPTRTTKRGTIAINYAEKEFEDTDFDDEDGPRRFTGLRSLRRDDSGLTPSQYSNVKSVKETNAPVYLQGIWRDWMGKPKRVFSQRQCQTQAELPVTLIPIRIDLDIQPFYPEAALPTPSNVRDYGIDESLPAYRRGDLTTQYRLKDMFMWNLHETLITPDQFAKTLVDELDFPADKKLGLIHQIVTQIRTQLEDYAGVAIHPLFHSSTKPKKTEKSLPVSNPTRTGTATPHTPNIGTPVPSTNDTTLNGAAVLPSTELSVQPQSNSLKPQEPSISVAAEPISASTDDTLDPDDTYRCILTLNVNILNKLYSDKFEWSLLHPPGFPETFARQTCADLALAPEWVPAITHAIYEAVLRLKKEACENGGLLLAPDTGLDNDAAHSVEAGWRYAPDLGLADEWEPKVEILSKEEIDRREGDRERQVRRQRRETARFSSTANMVGGIPVVGAAGYSSIDHGTPVEEDRLGRGERSKKKRRFRSLSPGGRETPEQGGYGGGPSLTEGERQNYRCSHCKLWGSAIWAVRDGPAGARSLCHNCGYLYERNGKLPLWSYKLFENQKHA